MTRFTAKTSAMLALLLAASALPAAGARADELRPDQARSIALGAVNGVVYYTTASNDYRVVATLGDAGAASPIRMVTMLRPDQTITLSVPRGPGEPAIEVSLTRCGNRVFVSNAGCVTD